VSPAVQALGHAGDARGGDKDMAEHCGDSDRGLGQRPGGALMLEWSRQVEERRFIAKPRVMPRQKQRGRDSDFRPPARLYSAKSDLSDK